MHDESAKALWSTVMAFDQRSWLAAGSEGAQGAEAWLVLNPEAWLNNTRGPDIAQSSRDKVFVIVGEAGSGKSTLMDLLATRETTAGNLPVYFDFKTARLLVGQTETEAILSALYETMRETVELAAENSGQSHALRAARIRYAVRTFTTDPFVKLREDYPGIKTFTDAQLLACTDAEDATRDHEQLHTRSFLTLMAAQFLATAPRATFLIDNVEGLTSQRRKLLFEILAAIQTANTLVVVAIRSEHIRETAVLPQAKPGDPYVLSHDRESFMAIARIRNEGALSYAKLHFPKDEIDKARELHDAFESSLQIIEGTDYLYALFTGWLNENVRDLLGLLSDMSRVLPTLRGRSVNGYVSTQLLNKHAHPSLARVLDPRRVPTTKNKDLPFVFLPLRILSYLKCRNSRVPLSDMEIDFEQQFGIGKGELSRAVEMFSNEETGKPYLLRVEEYDGVEHVHLVRCGETFIRKVVFQCDYLQTLYEQVESPQILPRNLDYSELKLRKSLAVIDSLIIPNFIAEHPYCGGQRATNRMRKRLHSYEHMFGFNTGHWFVGSLYRSLNDYVTARDGADLRLTKLAKPTLARLRAMEDRLDAVLGGAR